MSTSLQLHIVITIEPSLKTVVNMGVERLRILKKLYLTGI